MSALVFSAMLNSYITPKIAELTTIAKSFQFGLFLIFFSFFAVVLLIILDSKIAVDIKFLNPNKTYEEI